MPRARVIHFSTFPSHSKQANTCWERRKHLKEGAYKKMASISPKLEKNERRWCHTGLAYLWIAVLVFSADFASKTFAQAYLSPYLSVPALPFLNLTLVYNTGAAFSFLNTGSLWPNILFGSIALAASII